MSYEKSNIALNGDLITKDDFKEKETSLNSQILGLRQTFFPTKYKVFLCFQTFILPLLDCGTSAISNRALCVTLLATENP